MGLFDSHSDVFQRVKQAPLPKPDKVLRNRPLKEVAAAVSKLKRVVLFHPKPIVEKLPAQYCVCRKDEGGPKGKSKEMVQCADCWEWYHFACVGLADGQDVGNVNWKCEWCLDGADREGYHRWRSGRNIPKKRHHRDRPRLNGAQLGGNPPPRHSAPPTWEGKVAEVKELARRAAVKKRKLKEAAEQLVDEGGHHMVDAEGMAGLQLRAADDGLVDEFIGSGEIDPEAIDNSD